MRGQRLHAVERRMARVGRLHRKPFVEHQRIVAIARVELREHRLGALEAVVDKYPQRGEPVSQILRAPVALDKVNSRHAAACGKQTPRSVRKRPAPDIFGVRRIGEARRRPPGGLRHCRADGTAKHRLQRQTGTVDGIRVDVAADRLGHVDLAWELQGKRTEIGIELVVVGEALKLFRKARIEVWLISPREARRSHARASKHDLLRGFPAVERVRVVADQEKPVFRHQIRLHMHRRREFAEE
jgi:hypothetical protein